MFPDHGLDLNFSYLRDAPQITITGTNHYDGVYYLDPDSTKDQLIIKTQFVPEVFPPSARLSRNWERPVFFEFYENDNQLAFSQELGMRIHGGASRVKPQKSLRFYVRSEYGGNDVISHRLFAAEESEHYKRFLLRTSTEESGLDDALGQLLMRQVHPDMDIQRYRPAVVFINGEFWGLYSLRDRYDDWYLALKYGVDRDEIVFVEGHDSLKYGVPGDETHFTELETFIKNEDMAKTANYEYAQERIDIDNYIAYMLTGIYVNYTDWGISKHRQVWRYKKSEPTLQQAPSLDGRWRWLPLDLDGAFMRGGGPETDFLSQIIQSDVYLLQCLLVNDDFKTQFINRFADMMNTVLKEETAIRFVDDIVNELPHEVIEKNIRRWNHLETTDDWFAHVDAIKSFLMKRPAHMREHLCRNFVLSGTAQVTLMVGEGKGHITINSIGICPDTPGVHTPEKWTGIYFKDVPILISAIPAPGYRFANWHGNNSREETIRIVLKDDTTLTANFIKE